jgi:outer membrane immunogenic protein
MQHARGFATTAAIIAAMTTAALTRGTADAADLPQPPSYQAPAAIPAPPVYNWSGIYLGLNLGYGFGQSMPMSLYSDDFTAFSYNANGFLGGVTFGAQIQSGHTVLGVEGDTDWTNSKGSASGTVFFHGAPVGIASISSTLSSISTFRTRIGYASDNWLFYGTGGVAVTNEKSTLVGVTFICGTGGVTPACNSPSDLHLGLAAGAGIEYGLTPYLSSKLEYMWVGAGAGNTLKENMVRVGLNLRFGS